MKLFIDLTAKRGRLNDKTNKRLNSKKRLNNSTNKQINNKNERIKRKSFIRNKIYQRE